jgi:hypothetical protein
LTIITLGTADYSIHGDSEVFLGQRDDVLLWRYNIVPNDLEVGKRTKQVSNEPQLAFDMEIIILMGE